MSLFVFFHTAFKIPPKPVKIFKLPEFPPPMVHHHVQNYYGELIILLGKAIFCVPPENSTLLARYLVYNIGIIHFIKSHFKHTRSKKLLYWAFVKSS